MLKFGLSCLAFCMLHWMCISIKLRCNKWYIATCLSQLRLQRSLQAFVMANKLQLPFRRHFNPHYKTEVIFIHGGQALQCPSSNHASDTAFPLRAPPPGQVLCYCCGVLETPRHPAHIYSLNYEISSTPPLKTIQFLSYRNTFSHGPN